MADDLTDRLEKLVDIYTEGNKSKFAGLINMTPQTFNNYTAGNRKPGWDVMRRFLALGVNLNWLVAGIPPVKTSDIKEAGVSKIDMAAEPNRKDYFAHINTEDLSDAELHLLEEVKQFSAFLENRKTLRPQVKRLLLELLIQSIDQAIEPPQHDPGDN